MSGHGRSVDLDAPSYTEGVRVANLLLDSGEGARADRWIGYGEAAQETTHREDNHAGYHFARGFTDTIREFVEDQAS